MTAGRVTVVGAHGGQYFGAAAIEAVRSAAVVVGSARHLDFLEDRPDGSLDPEIIEIKGGLKMILDKVEVASRNGKDVCVLSSGDPGFFGIVRLVAERFGS